jgi:hypothetical protein
MARQHPTSDWAGHRSHRAIGTLLLVGGANPFWPLGVFALCVIIHGLLVYGEPETR